jgi:hypothetical protein
MATNNAINTGSLSSGFLYTDGTGAITATANQITTKFTTSGTWTKNSKTQNITVICWNGGGGGGSGRQGTTAASSGGGGGSAGAVLIYSGLASFFDASMAVTIGGGGAGGAGQTTPATNGIGGGASTITSLGNIFVNPNGAAGGGGGGSTTSGTGGQLQCLMIPVFNFTSGTTLSQFTGGSAGGITTSVTVSPQAISAVIDQFSQFIPQSGCGGSGANAVTAQQAGNGGTTFSFLDNSSGANATVLVAGGTGGISTGTIGGGNGSNAISTTGGRYCAASGGGGGGGMVAGTAGTGGNGGIPGGGGGGGGGSITGTTSGAGGNGGRGELWVIEYF